MTYSPQAGNNGARNKRIKARLVREYSLGKTGNLCMDELTKEFTSK